MSDFTALRSKIERGGYKCERCGSERDLQVHHKTPKSLGGSDDMDNLIILCSACHYKEHDRNRSELIKQGIARRKTLVSTISSENMFLRVQDLYDWIDNNDCCVTLGDLLHDIANCETSGIDLYYTYKSASGHKRISLLSFNSREDQNNEE